MPTYEADSRAAMFAEDRDKQAEAEEEKDVIECCPQCGVYHPDKYYINGENGACVGCNYCIYEVTELEEIQ